MLLQSLNHLSSRTLVTTIQRILQVLFLFLAACDGPHDEIGDERGDAVGVGWERGGERANVVGCGGGMKGEDGEVHYGLLCVSTHDI